MPLWISALGVGGIGIVYGYILIYALKRYMPPISTKPLSVKELVFLIATMSMSGTVGAAFVSMEGINYVGPYGLVLTIGAIADITLSLAIRAAYYREVDIAGNQEHADMGDS